MIKAAPGRATALNMRHSFLVLHMAQLDFVKEEECRLLHPAMTVIRLGTDEEYLLYRNVTVYK
jgi:hypothetical protein